jgi:class 3 adenylate cyclase
MSARLFAALLLLLALHGAAHLPAQSVADLEQQLKQTTLPEQQWDLNYRLSKNLLATDVVRAGVYADRSFQLAILLKDKKREAESIWLRADIAERQGQIQQALIFYRQTYDAAQAAVQPDLLLQATEKLQTLYARQNTYREAYEWSRKRSALLQEKSRLVTAEQRQKYEETEAALTQQKKRENRTILLLSGLLGLILTVLYYFRQRANRRVRGEMAEKNAMIEEKRRRSEQLLLNILPSAVAAELTVRNKVAARRYEHATVMFIDFVGFTKIAEILQPEELLAELDYCFSRFDDLIGRNRIEKIKTVGDAYICASGLSDRNERPLDMIKVALQIQDFLKKLRDKRSGEGKPSFEARIGIHFGPVVAGVVGTKKFAYDIWGDTVNTAARLEEACEPGRINVSGAARAVVLQEFQWEYRGEISAKNKGKMEMYYCLG